MLLSPKGQEYHKNLYGLVLEIERLNRNPNSPQIQLQKNNEISKYNMIIHQASQDYTLPEKEKSFLKYSFPSQMWPQYKETYKPTQDELNRAAGFGGRRTNRRKNRKSRSRRNRK